MNILGSATKKKKNNFRFGLERWRTICTRFIQLSQLRRKNDTFCFLFVDQNLHSCPNWKYQNFAITYVYSVSRLLIYSHFCWQEIVFPLRECKWKLRLHLKANNIRRGDGTCTHTYMSHRHTRQPQSSVRWIRRKCRIPVSLVHMCAPIHTIRG